MDIVAHKGYDYNNLNFMTVIPEKLLTSGVTTLHQSMQLISQLDIFRTSLGL